MTTPLDALRSLHRSLEAGRSGEELRPHWHPSAKIREYPNTIAPQGALRDLDDTLAASERGAGLLASQTYEEVESFELADRAIMRLTWTGVVGAAVGPFAAGQKLVAHIAQFARVADGQVIELATYDCYEPLAG